MHQKYFPADKNYILKEAQEAVKSSLIEGLFEQVKAHYLLLFNPLGLEDKLILHIKNCQRGDLPMGEVFYQKLAVIYRYRFGSNQLEFMFDGKSHLERYQEEWANVFRTWTDEFCQNPALVKLWMETAAFHAEDIFRIESVTNRVRATVERHFSMKLDKRKGLVVL